MNVSSRGAYWWARSLFYGYTKLRFIKTPGKFQIYLFHGKLMFGTTTGVQVSRVSNPTSKTPIWLFDGAHRKCRWFQTVRPSEKPLSDCSSAAVQNHRRRYINTGFVTCVVCTWYKYVLNYIYRHTYIYTYIYIYVYIYTVWWFGSFSILPYIGNTHPNWLIFFRGIETTNQIYIYIYVYIYTHYMYNIYNYIYIYICMLNKNPYHTSFKQVPYVNNPPTVVFRGRGAIAGWMLLSPRAKVWGILDFSPTRGLQGVIMGGLRVNGLKGKKEGLNMVNMD